MGRNAKQALRKKLFPRPVISTAGIVLALAALTLVREFGPALCLGVAAGALAFLRGTAIGGRLGNARLIGQAGPDITMRIGACLALAGMAAGAQGHSPAFAWPVRAVLALGQIALSVLAVALAVQAYLPKTTQAGNDGVA